MSHEQDGSNPEMREDMASQAPRPTGGSPGQDQYANQAQGAMGGGYGGYNPPPNVPPYGNPYPPQPQPPYPAGAYQNPPPGYAQQGYHAMHQDRYMGGASYPPAQNGSQMPNWPHQGQGCHGQQTPGSPYQAQNQGSNGPYHQGCHGHQTPGSPYQAQNQGSNGPYQNHYYDPYMANPGYPPRMPENNQPANGGFSSFFDFRDERFLKGALVGAAATFLLTNDSVQKNAINSIVKVWSLFQGGLEEVKERFRDAEAEIKTENNHK